MMYNNACTIVVSIINNNDNAVAMHLNKKVVMNKIIKRFLGATPMASTAAASLSSSSTASLAATRCRPVLNNDYNQKLE